MRDLVEKIEKDINTIDHFKVAVKAMTERLVSFLKPDMINEAKIISKTIAKAANDKQANATKDTTKEKSAKSTPVATPKVGGRRGRSGQQATTDANESNKENDEEMIEKAPDNRKGRREKNSTAAKDLPEHKDKVLANDKKEDAKTTKDEKKEPARKGRGRGRVAARGKENEITDGKEAASPVEISVDVDAVKLKKERKLMFLLI